MISHLKYCLDNSDNEGLVNAVNNNNNNNNVLCTEISETVPEEVEKQSQHMENSQIQLETRLSESENDDEARNALIRMLEANVMQIHQKEHQLQEQLLQLEQEAAARGEEVAQLEHRLQGFDSSVNKVQGWLNVSCKADFVGHTKETSDDFAGNALFLIIRDFAKNALF